VGEYAKAGSRAKPQSHKEEKQRECEEKKRSKKATRWLLAPLLLCDFAALREILFPYFTSSITLSLCELNSGAYMHWMFASPVGYWPLCCTRTAYSKTYTPFGR
jgi:hypothetical protein